MTDEQLILPGLDDERTSSAQLVEAVRASLRELRELGLIDRRHAAHVQLAIELATAVDRGNRGGRASAAAMAARELRETLVLLDPPPEDGGAGVDAMRDLRELVASLNAAAQAQAPALRVVDGGRS